LLGSAFELTIVGMGVVFLSLLGLMYVIKLLNRASTGWNHRDHWSEAKDESAPEAEPAGENGDLSLVLAAATGYFLETERAEVFIPELKRTHESSWARRARTGRSIPRRPR
jgi:sodium pump decarboxylase gamma subunit